MSSSEKASTSRIALAGAVMTLATLFAVATLAEWWPIIVARDTVHIASCRFGAAATVAHGGWRYSNPELYAWTAFAEAMAGLATLPAIWMTIVRRSRKAALALVVICAAYAGTALVLGQITWVARATLALLWTARHGRV